jgi:hypothetical protein
MLGAVAKPVSPERLQQLLAAHASRGSAVSHAALPPPTPEALGRAIACGELLPAVEVGLGYINTATDVLEATYSLPGISSSYVNILSANSDFSKLYVMTSAFDANWNLTGAVAVFDTNTKSFGQNLVEGISGMNGIAFNKDKVFCFISENVTGNGAARSYKTDGAFVKEYETGIAPFMILNVE